MSGEIPGSSRSERLLLQQELSKRVFDRQTNIELATHFLDQRRDHNAFSIAGRDFFAKHLGTSAIPERLIGRYYRELFALSLVVRSESRTPDTIPVQLESKCRSGSQMNSAYALFGGYYVNGDSQPHHRANRIRMLPVHTGFLEAPGSNHMTSAGLRPSIPVLHLENTSREIHVRAVAWLIVTRNQLPLPYPEIQWNPDGTPVIPPNALWHERIELQKTIKVAPD